MAASIPHGEREPTAATALAPASFRPPAARASSVRREHLIALLSEPDGPPVTALIAPPGYGKTTVLAEWAAQARQPVAWLTLTDLDNDPVRLLTYIIAAYAHVGPLGRDVTGPLTTGADRLLAGPLPRLLAQLSSWETPAILVLDDIHRIVEQEALDLLSVLLDRLPDEFRVALAGRSTPGLPFARLRAHRLLREIGTRQLALDVDETVELARRAGVPLAAGEAQELAMRTEGWAAGIYLAILGSADDGGRPAVGRVSGADHYIADYLRSEVGRGLANDDLTFLTRTSILETVMPGSALAVSGLDEPAQRLERMATSNLLISRVEGVPDTYRYHTTLREYLRAELDKHEPGAANGLHARAAAYFASVGDGESAIGHAFEGQDLAAAARYLVASILPMYQAGRGNLLLRWLEQFTTRDFERVPMLAILGSWLYLLEGRAEPAEALADIADRTDPEVLGSEARAFVTSRMVLRAVLGRHGMADAVANASRALRDDATPRQWAAAAAVLLGTAHLASANVDVEAAAGVLDEALALAPATAHGVQMSAHALRAALCLQLDDVEAAAVHAARGREVLANNNDLGSVTSLVVYAVDARIRALRGDVTGARDTLVRAQLVRALASHASPWQSLPPLLDLARAYLALSDPGGAQTVLRQAEDIVRKRPGVGGYGDQLIALRRKLQDASNVLAGSSTLTTAELRVLPLLPTYLSFEEIGERLNVSRNTVKTHAMSIYGKLWASSRGEAVERAVELGLLEPYPVLVRRPGTSEPT